MTLVERKSDLISDFPERLIERAPLDVWQQAIDRWPRWTYRNGHLPSMPRGVETTLRKALELGCLHPNGVRVLDLAFSHGPEAVVEVLHILWGFDFETTPSVAVDLTDECEDLAIGAGIEHCRQSYSLGRGPGGYDTFHGATQGDVRWMSSWSGSLSPLVPSEEWSRLVEVVDFARDYLRAGTDHYVVRTQVAWAPSEWPEVLQDRWNEEVGHNTVAQSPGQSEQAGRDHLEQVIWEAQQWAKAQLESSTTRLRNECEGSK